MVDTLNLGFRFIRVQIPSKIFYVHFMLFIVVLLPLLGAFFSGLFGWYVGRHGSIFISIICMLFVTLISIYHFWHLLFYKSIYFVTLFPWIHSNIVVVNWGFLFDSVTFICFYFILSLIFKVKQLTFYKVLFNFLILFYKKRI